MGWASGYFHRTFPEGRLLLLVAIACSGGCGPSIVAPPGETAGDSRRDSPGDSPSDTWLPADSSDSGAAPPPIVIAIVADDLGDNFLWALPEVSARLVPESVRFTRTYATAPLCCPVRASFLEGGFTVRSTGG